MPILFMVCVWYSIRRTGFLDQKQTEKKEFFLKIDVVHGLYFNMTEIN